MLARVRFQLLSVQRRTAGYSTRKLPTSKAPTRPPTNPKDLAEKGKANTSAPEGEPSSSRPHSKDFRSPWIFKAVGVANFIVVPIVGIYAAFYWDWGDDGHDNVMQPIRRWVKRQQNAFFSLSPPELALATPGLTLSPQESVESLETSDPMTTDVPKGFFKPFFRVKGVNPDGPAAIAGLHNDDLIVSFGEIPVRSLPPLTYQDMIKTSVKNNTAIPVLVMRPGKHLLLLLTPTREAGLGCDLQRYQPGQVNR
ncbi:hypothetical protein C8J57DRAFT_1706674 [Mycena rebaudengoi]|nr:hypothetical protein C8J57DRAFT_1706674 [Mycena rebaudengoi]